MATYTAKDLIKGYTLDAQGQEVPVPAGEMAQVAVTIEHLRDELRDRPHLNEITKQELTDDEYADCVINAIAQFNGHGPMFTQFDAKDFPHRDLLIRLSVVKALKRLYRWHSRQQWSIEDAGLRVPLHEAWQPLMTDAREEERDCRDLMNELKQRMNIAAGWGEGVGSPLGWGYP